MATHFDVQGNLSCYYVYPIWYWNEDWAEVNVVFFPGEFTYLDHSRTLFHGPKLVLNGCCVTLALTPEVTKLEEPAEKVDGAMVTPVVGPMEMIPPAMVTTG